MINSVKLPIYKSPIVGLHNLAYPLVVLSGHKECIPWFYSNYLQLKCDKKFKSILTFCADGYSALPWLDTELLAKNLLEKKHNLHELVCSRIENCAYFSSSYDEFYIPTSPAYRSRHFDHDFLIYGYDKNAREYNVLAYTSRRTLEAFTISFDQFYSAFHSKWIRKRYNLYFFKKKKTSEFSFSIKKILDLLRDYSAGRRPSQKYVADYIRMPTFLGMDIFRFLKYLRQKLDTRKIAYGMDVYKYLKIHLKSFFVDKKSRSPMTSLHILYEHKKNMAARLQYIRKKRLAYVNTKDIKGYLELARVTLQMRNLLIKFRITNQNIELEKIIKSLERCESLEREILERLIASFSKPSETLGRESRIS